MTADEERLARFNKMRAELERFVNERPQRAPAHLTKGSTRRTRNLSLPGATLSGCRSP